MASESIPATFGSSSFSLARHRARTRLAIHGLPTEILLEVFQILKDVSPPGRCKTMRVPDPRPNHGYGVQNIHRREQLSGRLSQHCDMGWIMVTYLALAHSSLWASLDCTALTFQWVSEIITRAGSRPLDIRLDFTDYPFLHLRKPLLYEYYDPDPDPPFIHLGGVAQMFLYRARQRSLFATSSASSPAPSTGTRHSRPLPSILPHLDLNSICALDLTGSDVALSLQSRDSSIQVDPISLPRLESLRLSSRDGHGEFHANFLSAFAPRLKRLYLTQCSVAWNADLPHLTHLSIVYQGEAHLFPPNPCPTMDERVHFLTSMPLLEELVLEEAVPLMLPSHRRGHTDTDLFPTIALPPTLKLLRLAGPRCIEDCIGLAKRFDVSHSTRVDVTLGGTQAVISMSDLFARYAGPARAPGVLRLSLAYDILDTYAPELQVSVHAEAWHDEREREAHSAGVFHPPGIPALRLAVEGPQAYLADRLNPCHGLCPDALTHLILVAFNDVGPKLLGLFLRARNVRRVEVHESETGIALLKMLARAAPTEEDTLFPALHTLFLLEDRDGDEAGMGPGAEGGPYVDEERWKAGGEAVALLEACLGERRARGMPVKMLGLPRRHADAAWVGSISEKVECVRFCG
ncbi:hypothetical protein OF83DRAFT_1170516 [Amylostereum chailletii]|nr:hypothetical protein OF83DRAFT_1170516 [Amylostereum chailletii]